MAGAVKHMERSHKTMSKNYSQYRKSAIRTSGNKISQKQIRSSVFERLLSLF